MDYYQQIKTKLMNNAAYKKVKHYSANRNDLNTYFKVGELIVTAQGGKNRNGYGNTLIQQYSRKLQKELGKGYSTRNLYNMRSFYLYFEKSDILQTLSAKLTWSHFTELFKLHQQNQINYYINLTEQQNLSVRQLREHIKHQDYERLPHATKIQLQKQNSRIQSASTISTIATYLKDPIVIRGKANPNTELSEKILQQLILEDLPHFLRELGDGFTFISNEYKIKIDDNYNYIDLLLFNIKFNCYVVIELKITELKAEHIGQVQKYIKAVDLNLRDLNQQPTVGVVIVRKHNQFIRGYCSDERIFGVKWRLD